MNLIFVSMDSLNRHFLSAYGGAGARTPNIDAFAGRACVFDQHYAGSVPCMPARREVWTGTQECWWRYWGPTEPWDLTVAYWARRAGAASMLVTDHYHFFEWGSHGYQNDFHGYEFIRGHESDNWATAPIGQVPDWAEVMLKRSPGRAQYVRNVLAGPSAGQREEDFCSPRTFRAAAEWLDRNAAAGLGRDGKPFYLHVDSFDPHEPFHVPEPYRSMYTDDDYRRYSPWPNYGRTDAGDAALSDAELAWVRAQYAGKVTMADAWFGRLLDTIDKHKLWDNTAVVLTTDHGHYLGDHGWIGKPHAPLYRTLVHIPLMIWLPGGQCGGRHTGAITSAVDLYATMLDVMGVEPPPRPNVHSRSLMPVLGGADRHRDFALYGYCNSQSGVTDGRWALTRAHDDSAGERAAYTMEALATSFGQGARGRPVRDLVPHSLTAATIPGVNHPVWRGLMPNVRKPDGTPPGPWRPDHLWDLDADPGQECNVADAHPDQVARLAAAMRDHLRSIAAPEEQFARLHL